MSRIDLYPNLKSTPADARVATGTSLPGDKFAQDVNMVGGSLSGEVHLLAPTGPFFITVDTATDVATNPIAVPLAGRVSLSIRNKGAVVIYIGQTALVTADDTATGGWEIGPGEDSNWELDSSNLFYLITPAGTTALFKILEIAST